MLAAAVVPVQCKAQVRGLAARAAAGLGAMEAIASRQQTGLSTLVAAVAVAVTAVHILGLMVARVLLLSVLL